jgi:hypothetical protein
VIRENRNTIKQLRDELAGLIPPGETVGGGLFSASRPNPAFQIYTQRSASIQEQINSYEQENRRLSALAAQGGTRAGSAGANAASPQVTTPTVTFPSGGSLQGNTYVLPPPRS